MKYFITLLLISLFQIASGQVLLGKKIHQLPERMPRGGDSLDLMILGNASNGTLYRARKKDVLSGITGSAGVGGLTNGDKGDIIVSDLGEELIIDFNTVFNNQLALAPPNVILGNPTGVTQSLSYVNQSGMRSFLNYHPVSLSGSYTDLINKPTIPSQFNPMAGNYIGLTGTYPNITIANTMPVLNLIAGTNVTVSGTYPNITVNSTSTNVGDNSMTSLAADPTTSDLDNQEFGLFKHTGTSNINLFVNDGGVIKKAGGSNTLDQTLALGNVTDTAIIQEDIDDITREIKPSNYNTSYGNAGVAKGFIEGVKAFAGVNSPDSRPNVVYSFGYNVDISGSRINTSEAAFRFGYETNYNINSDTARRGFEFHMPEITTKEGSVLRLWSMYVNKSGGYTELNSQMENLYFTKVSNGDNWITLNNSNTGNVIHQYGNDSASVIYTAMTNPDTQAGRIVTRYSPTGSDTYEYSIAADNPVGKLFTTNMSTRFDNSLLSTSFMNINNTSSTGTPSLTLDHANSGSSKVQVWNYNASLVAEVDKDYSLMAYKPVLLYYGGLTHGDFTFMAGNLNLGSQNLIGGSKIALGLTATKNPFVDLVVGDGGDGTDNEPYGLRLRGNSSDGNTRVLQFGVNTTGIGGDNQGYGYIQFGYWGGSQNNPLVLQPKAGAVVVGNPVGLADYKLQVEKELSIKATNTDAGGALRGRISFPYSSIYAAKSSYIAGISDATYWYESSGLVFATISGPDISGSQGIERMRIAGNGNVGIGTTTDISASPAKLQIASTTSGFLPPRMTTTQKNAISVPVEGLIVYDTTLHKLCVYTGSAWETITSL